MFIDPETRRAMGEQAVALSKAVGYSSAGVLVLEYNIIVLHIIFVTIYNYKGLVSFWWTQGRTSISWK